MDQELQRRLAYEGWYACHAQLSISSSAIMYPEPASGRRKLIVGNWKMNGLIADGIKLAHALAQRPKGSRLPCDIVVCPPATLITTLEAVLADTGISIGGQNCHQADNGSHTGEVSAMMLKDAGCSHVILGHSERRHGCRETNGIVRKKVKAAWRVGLVPILCVGDTREQRDTGREFAEADVLAQFIDSMPACNSVDRLVVAYEPVSAIGSDLPTAIEITAVHHMIRAHAPDARVLYGGCVSSQNASAVLDLDEVDGLLVGRASLDAAEFWTIAETAARPNRPVRAR